MAACLCHIVFVHRGSCAYMKMEKWVHVNVAARVECLYSHGRAERTLSPSHSAPSDPEREKRKKGKILIQQRPSAQKTFRCVTAGRAHIVNGQIKDG